MGSCFSKKKDPSSSSSSPPEVPAATQHPVDPIKSQKNDKALSEVQDSTKKGEAEEEAGGLVKKEIFVIKHRKSHDKRSLPQQDEGGVSVVETKEESGNNVNVNVVRTSSCTKEEVDAILIQCGRLSRSNSSGKTASSAKKYSGSKRSYDFDHNDVDGDAVVDADGKKKGSDDDDDDEDNDQRGERRQHRQRHRHSSRRSPSQGRRRTPSRERDQQQQQRSGSRERGGSGSGSGSRRVSRSPGRRSENNSLATATTTTNCNRPGKMVSVPATVNSLVMDKSNNGVVEPATTTTAIKRITVKRNVGEAAAVGSRTAASPRSQSPARTNANGNKTSIEGQQQPSLSRNSSRKAEHSPYRRNPLAEIDPNSLANPQSSTPNIKPPTNNNSRVQNRSRGEVEGEGVLYQKPNVDQIGSQGTNYKVSSSRGTLNNKVVNTICTEKEQQQILGEVKAQIPITSTAASGAESQKPQTLTRSRSSRRSRDLDINPETLLNSTPSYTALLLEDIQNFHQKKNNSNNNNTPSFSLPPCVTKACSILEAVADLNSTTSSNLSCAFSVGKQMPFVESEVLASDDLTEPSFHKYVTVRRGGGTLGGSDLDEQESSGSNSYVGGATQQNWSFSSSSWEPNSADSTDRWTSRSNTKEDDKTSVGHQRHALSETRKGVNGKKRDNDLHQKDGVWRGRVGASKGPQTVTVVAAAAST